MCVEFSKFDEKYGILLRHTSSLSTSHREDEFDYITVSLKNIF